MLQHYLLCKENTANISISGQELSGFLGQAMGILPWALFWLIYLPLAGIYTYIYHIQRASGIDKYSVLFSVAQSPYNE